MRYSDILANDHFQNIAATMRSIRFNDPQADFLSALDALRDVTWPFMAHDWLDRFVDLQVVMAEKYRMTLATSDIEWLVEQLGVARPDAILALLLACATAPEETLTPAEIAELTGTAESGWRNKAAAGLLPGAMKKGKQWLIPARYVNM